MFRKMKLAITALAAVLLSASASSAQGTALVPIVVNVDAVVTITPPAGAEDAVGATKSVSANTPDTLAVALGSGYISVSHRPQTRPNAPAAVSHSRGNVSLKLQPQQYANAMVSLYSINGKRLMSGRVDASKATHSISRPNIASGAYLLKVKGAKGSSYATRLTHSGGRLNINIAFASESAALPLQPALAKASSAASAWTIAVQAEGYVDTSYTFYPVEGVNQVQNITLLVRPFVIDISQETEWKYMVVGGDGSTVFIDVDESTDIPTRMFLRPENDSDEGLTIFFKESGLPDKLVVDEHILYFDNFRGYKYDLAVIYPDNTIRYHHNIETDVNWDDYISASGLAKAHFWGNVFKTLSYLPVVPAISCSVTAFAPNPVTAKVCVTSTVSYVSKFVIEQLFDGFTEDAGKALVDVLVCAEAAVTGNVFSLALNCTKALASSASLLSHLNSTIIDEKDWELERALEELAAYQRWRDGITLGEPLVDPRNNRKYTTVVIGSQTWMAENLDYVDPSWPLNDFTGNFAVRDKGSWCYTNNQANCDRYGRLYTWDAAMVACPAGWRVPDDGDWGALFAAAGSSDVGRKLLSRSIGGGTDNFGFSALPGGGYLVTGPANFFESRGDVGYWWSASENAGNTAARSRHIDRRMSGLYAADESKRSGFSVRCVQDNDYPPAKEWMNRNLNVETPDSWCYDDDPANCEAYGRLYTWEAALAACPAFGDGWRLPTRTDWNALVNRAGGYVTAGEKLKAATSWNDNGNGTDELGFSALSVGFRMPTGNFSVSGYSGLWWSSRERDSTYAYPLRMYNNDPGVDAISLRKDLAITVRCVR